MGEDLLFPSAPFRSFFPLRRPMFWIEDASVPCPFFSETCSFLFSLVSASDCFDYASAHFHDRCRILVCDDFLLFCVFVCGYFHPPQLCWLMKRQTFRVFFPGRSRVPLDRSEFTTFVFYKPDKALYQDDSFSTASHGSAPPRTAWRRGWLSFLFFSESFDSLSLLPILNLSVLVIGVPAPFLILRVPKALFCSVLGCRC